MDSRWHLLEPREGDPPDVVCAKLLQLQRLVKIYEARLERIERQPDSRTRVIPVEQQQPAADEANAPSQQVISIADSADSPFRIKRKDAEPKKGALGFRPLLRSSSKPTCSVKKVVPADSAESELPEDQSKAGSLPGEHQLSPSAFRTPAVTRSLHQIGTHLSSDVPTEKAADTALPTSMPEPAHNPRPWARLQLQQHGAKAALSAQHLQQQPDSGQRLLQGVPPLQEVSNNSSGWLAPERPRGFQGKLRLRKTRPGTGVVKKGFPGPPSGQQGLQGPSHAASIAAHTAQHQSPDHKTEQDGDPEDVGITPAASPELGAVDRVHAAVEDAQDLVDITPEQPRWRSKQSRRLQHLAESAPARRQAGPGRLPLVQQPLTHPAGTSTLLRHQQSGIPSLQQHSPEEHWGSLRLTLEHPQGQPNSKSSSSVAIGRHQEDSSSSGRLQRLTAAGFVPETCAQACDAVPDTPDCRISKQATSRQSPVQEAPLGSSDQQQGNLAVRHQTLDGSSNSVNPNDAQPIIGEGPLAAEYTGSKAPDVKDGSCKKDTGTFLRGHSNNTAHGSRYHFGKPIVSVAASSSGRCIAVCLMEQGSASCSVQVWSMQEEGATLKASMLSAGGSLKAGNVGPYNVQQLLAVSSAGDRVVLASSAVLRFEEGTHHCVSLLCTTERSLQHKTLSLPTQQESACVYMSSTSHLFAAGQGGHVHCWSLGNDLSLAAPQYQQLPGASFGGITFPDIQHLESAGMDCILGCSSVGSVALWNFARGELLMARQEAGHLLHGLRWLPAACMPHLAGQPPGKRPVAALALAQRRRRGSGTDLAQHLALTLMWPEQIAMSVLSEAEAVTHIVIVGAHAALALSSGCVKLVDLQKMGSTCLFQGTTHVEYGGMGGIRGLTAAGPNALVTFFDDSLILLDCFQRGV